MWGLGTLPDGELNRKKTFTSLIYFHKLIFFFFLKLGFPAAAYAAYAAGRGYSGYPSFGLPYHPTGNLIVYQH